MRTLSSRQGAGAGWRLSAYFAAICSMQLYKEAAKADATSSRRDGSPRGAAAAVGWCGGSAEGRYRLNFASAFRLPLMVSVQVGDSPLQAPPHSRNVAPFVGVAVSVTTRLRG